MHLAIALVLAALTSSNRIDTEYRRLDDQLKRLTTAGVPKELEPELQSAREAIKRGADATGDEYRLYRLRDAFVTVERLQYVVNHSRDDLQKLWNRERSRFEKHPGERGTALERALAQSSSTRAERYFAASLSYAKATTPFYGLVYLGDASANLAFRDFVRGLADRTVEKTPSSGQIASTLDALDSATLEFFSTRVTTADANPVSARLKEARELLNAGRKEGAMLLAVEASIVLADRGGPPLSGQPGAVVLHDSMASLLTQWPANETQPDRKKNREKAMAFYAGLFSAAPPVPATKPQVVVTLVRWPYT
jgi:hypothetical protein